jgi:3'(2'), 5'-bisphosphate nucleotidase
VFEEGAPVLGVVYVPDSKVLYYGLIGAGSFKIKLGQYNIDSILELGIVKLIDMSDRLPAEVSGDVFKVVGSRSHMTKETKEYIEHLSEKHSNVEVISAGSAIKLCLVAEGVANEYPRFAPTMEWDTAAGHAIANQAGKKVFAYGTQKELTYNRENNVNGWFLVK